MSKNTQNVNTEEIREGKTSTIAIILFIQLAIMIALILVMTITTGRLTRENALNNMATITDERAQIIENYVENAEKTLRSFGKASQVKDLLKLGKTMDLHDLVDENSPNYASRETMYPEAMAALRAAQEYTVDFGNDIDNLEGIWIGTWETLVLTHTNEPVVGMTTRTDHDRLLQLQSAMTNGDDGLYNAGIIISPATQKQILSMYIQVTDESGKPIGLVGLGIFTDQLVDNLDAMEIRGIEDTSYSMVNVSDNKYIFHSNRELVTQEASNPKVLALTADPQDSGSFEYSDGSGKFVSAYSYMPKYGWIMMLDAPRSEVYSMTYKMLIFVVVFGVLIIGLILVFAFLNERQQRINRRLSKQIMKTEKTKESLSAAMFKDVLTNAFNRVSFSIDLDQSDAASAHPYYFAMFNILDCSSINTSYGNDMGDSILVKVADTLKEHFAKGKVYRTGSDEFVVAVPTDTAAQATRQEVMQGAREAQAELMRPVELYGMSVTPSLKIVVGQKSGHLDSSVIASLKDVSRRQQGETPAGNIYFSDTL